jgi:HK97 family phage major capsid protein/HK97 family phage prohead protease
MTNRIRTLPSKLEKLSRSIDFECAADGAPQRDEGGRYRVSISSEAPCDRWFGREILDHGAESVDLTRFDRGLPLLVDHDTADHVGLIEGPEIGTDRKLRGWMRFGRSGRAQEIERDVQDGIRKDMSVGYRIRTMVLEERDEEKGDTYRATKWAPMEGSIVAVPADIEVGVGRSGDESALPVEVVALASAPTEAATKERSMETTPAAPDPGVKVTTVERGEVAEIARLAKEHDCMDRVSGWLEKGTSVADVQKEIMSVLTERTKATLTRAGGDVLDLSPKDKGRYNLCRAILAQAKGDWRDAGFEREVSDALEKKLDSSIVRHGGMFVPTTLPMEARAQPPLVAGTASVGGNIVFTQAGTLIELLRNNLVIQQLGAQFLSGLTGGPLSFPRQITGATASWTGEATSVAGSYLTLDRLTLSPKNLTGWTSYSRSLLAQSTPDVDQMVRADLALIHAIAIDRAGLRGAGTLEPTGIISTSSIGSVTVGTNGGAATFAHIVGLEEAVDIGNALAGSLAYVTTPQVKADLKQTAVLTNTIGVAVWGTDSQMNGYRAMATNQIPSNLTKGTSTTVCHAIVFGNFRELIVGEWATFELLADPITLADSGQIKLVTYQMVDVGVRHAASFAACLDVTS